MTPGDGINYVVAAKYMLLTQLYNTTYIHTSSVLCLLSCLCQFIISGPSNTNVSYPIRKSKCNPRESMCYYWTQREVVFKLVFNVKWYAFCKIWVHCNLGNGNIELTSKNYICPFVNLCDKSGASCSMSGQCYRVHKQAITFTNLFKKKVNTKMHMIFCVQWFICVLKLKYEYIEVLNSAHFPKAMKLMKSNMSAEVVVPVLSLWRTECWGTKCMNLTLENGGLKYELWYWNVNFKQKVRSDNTRQIKCK